MANTRSLVIDITTKLERSLKPDYVGGWEGNLPGEFKMYILRRMATPIPCTVFPAIVDDITREIETIEGFGTDSHGVWVFSGTMTKSTGEVGFTKNYSEVAVRRGGIKRIDYKGRFSEDGHVEGTYSSREKGRTYKGKFWMDAVK